MNPFSYATDSRGPGAPVRQGTGGPTHPASGGQMTVEGRDSRSRTLTLGGYFFVAGRPVCLYPLKASGIPTCDNQTCQQTLPSVPWG